jgi:hypothetical protein
MGFELGQGEITSDADVIVSALQAAHERLLRP